MYCIVSVVYGSPLSQKIYDKLEALGFEPEDVDLTTMYSGGADVTPGYCGVELDNFDECNMSLKLSSLKLSPTAAQVAEEAKIRAALPQEIQNLLPPPEVIFVFSTS